MALATTLSLSAVIVYTMVSGLTAKGAGADSDTRAHDFQQHCAMVFMGVLALVMFLRLLAGVHGLACALRVFDWFDACGDSCGSQCCGSVDIKVLEGDGCDAAHGGAEGMPSVLRSHYAPTAMIAFTAVVCCAGLVVIADAALWWFFLAACLFIMTAVLAAMVLVQHTRRKD